MKTTITSITAHVPTITPDDDGIRRVKITTERGDLMMNRLRRELRVEHDTADNPPDQRVTIEPSNELLLQVVEAYIKKSKAMKRMDRKLDKMRQENNDWQEFAGAMYGVLGNLSAAAENFIHAVVETPGGGDELLAKITEELDDLQGAISDANEIFDAVECEDECEGEECTCDIG